MNAPADHRDPIPLQARLLICAAAFVVIYAVMLTLAPVIRLRSWEVGLSFWQWIPASVWLIGFGLLYVRYRETLAQSDPYLYPLMGLLTGWGLMTITRLDPSMGLRQTIWMALGLAVFWFGVRIPTALTLLRRYKYIWLVLALGLTALTFIFGIYPGGEGPRLWLGCCGVYLQPSEPLKLLLIAYLAAYLADRLPVNLRLFTLLAPTLLLIGTALLLLVVQRDLGTATLLIFIYSLTLYLASGRKRMLLMMAAALLAAGFLGYELSSVVRLRFNAWLNPWADPTGSAYQIIQSILAIASGGFIGSGPGLGSPGVVPVAVSDFIFTAVAEETGILGAVGLLLCFAMLVMRGLVIALRAPFNYHRYLAAGISAYFASQIILIVGGNLRLLPLTGVTLPFLSYGGSSLLTSFAAGLILQLISRQSDQDPAPLLHTRPYLFFYSLTAVGFVAMALAVGWYGFVRQDSLVSRIDNPRRSINELYVQRGSLLDRHGQPLVVSSGDPGSISRQYLYPALSTTTGYVNPLYGLSGLEASQDPYLRGVSGLPSLTIWTNRMLYGQTPPGLDMHLSIDLDLQKLTDAALGDRPGAVVLLNASTGEILAISSHPYYNPNTLDQDWSTLITASDGRLINRATQGLYPPGTAITPILLSEVVPSIELPEIPQKLSVSIPEAMNLGCAVPPDSTQSWNAVLSSGCPAPLVLLGSRFQPSRMDALFERFNLGTAPSLPLPAATPILPPVKSTELAAVGRDGMQVSPMQMALLAAVFSAKGNQPEPILPLSIKTPHQGWVVLAQSTTMPILSASTAAEVTSLLAQPGRLYWSVTASAGSIDKPISWFIGGSLDSWRGAPVAIAVLLENDTPLEARIIGEKILQSALNSAE